MKLLSANEAAKILGVHHSRVRVLIREGRLPAQKVGRDWVIFKKDLEKVKDRKPGRPKKKEDKSEIKEITKIKKLQGLFKEDMTKISEKLSKGKITNEQFKHKLDFHKNALKLLEKTIKLYVKARAKGNGNFENPEDFLKEVGSFNNAEALFNEARETHSQLENMCKKEGLL
jgi:excisionase family DNA binding protein